MKIVPIKFTDEMIQSILAGRKTQTRRLIKPQPAKEFKFSGYVVCSSEKKREGSVHWENGSKDFYSKPPCEIGDLLCIQGQRTFLDVTMVKVQPLQEIDELDSIYEGVPTDEDFPHHKKEFCSVCHGEGVLAAVGDGLGVTEVDCRECDTETKRFKNLWNSIYGPKAWDENPWVWVIEFRKL